MSTPANVTRARQSRLDAFWLAYEGALQRAMAASPAEYGLRAPLADDVLAFHAAGITGKMRIAVAERGWGAVNYRTPTFRAAAKACGLAFNLAGLRGLFDTPAVFPPAEARLLREGWELYPIPADERGAFREDLKQILLLIGSAMYEWQKIGGLFFIRRVT